MRNKKKNRHYLEMFIDVYDPKSRTRFPLLRIHVEKSESEYFSFHSDFSKTNFQTVTFSDKLVGNKKRQLSSLHFPDVYSYNAVGVTTQQNSSREFLIKQNFNLISNL